MDIQFLNCTVPDVLTPMEAAKILHIGRSTIYHLLAQGPLCTSQRPEAVSPLRPTDIEHNIKAWNGNSRLLLIFFIFCDILQPTVQSSTQLVQCFSLHIFVGMKPIVLLSIPHSSRSQYVDTPRFSIMTHNLSNIIMAHLRIEKSRHKRKSPEIVRFQDFFWWRQQNSNL